MLIAVVSDSYECAIIKSKFLFRRARLELVAEFDTMFTIFTSHRPSSRGDGYAKLNETGHAIDDPTLGVCGALGRLARPLARAIKMGADDDDGGEENAWPGRALDMERRMGVLLAAYEARATTELDARIAASEARIIDAIRRVHA